MKKITFLMFFMMTALAATAQSVFVNELHYDNTGGDIGEFVEIAGPAGTDLTGWTIVKYNGNGGSSYGADPLTPLVITDQGSGYGTATISYPSNGLQNGAPDGFALVDDLGAVIQFLSYEGSFTATNGPASGMTSTDIGVSESSSTPVGQSLQLVGTGNEYSDFSWSGPTAESPGGVNTGQTFVTAAPSGVAECAGSGEMIPPMMPGSVRTVTIPVPTGGIIGEDSYQVEMVNLFLESFQHNTANELSVTLTAPDGTTAMIFTNDGGTDGLTVAENITFLDGGNDIDTWTSDATFAPPYESQDGPFNGEGGVGAFDGVQIYGDWTLTITNGGNAGGSLADACLTFDDRGLVGTVPTITCPTPNPFMTEAEPGLCSAEVVFADASAVDVEDGPLMVVRTDMTGLNSGDQFPVGTTTISFMVTDSDGNSASCDFVVTVNDTQAPTVTCADAITQDNDAGACGAMVTVPAPVVEDNCDGAMPSPIVITNDYNAQGGDVDDFFPVGETTVEYTISDGTSTTTCSVVVTVVDAEAPVIVCEGSTAFTTVTESATPANTGTSPGDLTLVETIDIAADQTITDLNVDLDIEHTWVGDLQITLTSPAGTSVLVFDGDNDGCRGDDLVVSLDDQSGNDLEADCNNTNPGQAYAENNYAPSNPLAMFNGESTMGTWTLAIVDTFTGNAGGVLNAWGLEYSYEDGTLPVYDVQLDNMGMASLATSDLIISATDNCTADVDLIYANTTPGPICVYSNSDLATSDGSLSTGAAAPFIFANDFTLAANANFTLTDMSIEFQANTGEGYTTVDLYYYEDNSGVPGALIGSEAGVTLVEVDRAVFNADRDDILYTIDMADFDFSNPSATDATPFWIGTDAVPSAGNRDGVSTDTVNITGQQLTFTTDGGATWLTSDDLALPARDGVYSFNDAICLNANPDPTMVSFTCDNVGLNNVDVTVTDAAGNSTTCTAVVNVIDDIDPVLVCMDFTLELDDNGVATLDPNDAIDEDATVEACGYEATASRTDFSCADIGTPVLVDIFVIDPSGNVATCSATITVVDVNGPVLTCPDDQTVSPEANGVYTLEDFTGLTTATDGCDGNVDVISQSPAPGTSLGVGTYTITMTSADSTANESTCTFELTVSPIQGVGESELSAAIVLYPNPATEMVNLSNNSTIALDRAAIYNVNGQLVSDINLDGMIGERTIDVSSLASGVYMVQVSGENNVVVKRLIIE